jgi:hypothetical protein
MTPEITNRFVTTFIVFLTIVSIGQAKYGGGSGTAEDPYQIATAGDLIALGESPEDYDKHFILTADIDLDPNLPGRKVFDKAVIAPDVNDAEYWFQGTPFTGVFDGDGHRVSNLKVTGRSYLGVFGQLANRAEVKDLGVVDVNVVGSGDYVGGLVGENSGTVTCCYSTGAVSTGYYVGGLVGSNSGTVTQCYSSGTVRGFEHVGGLAGTNHYNYGHVAYCYSSGAVAGWNDVGGLLGDNGADLGDCYSTAAVTGVPLGRSVGGLVGGNWGDVTGCYSSGAVRGGSYVGGLVGEGSASRVTVCFWDIETSGQTTSAGGTGKTTAEMQTESTFSCWGGDDVWTIDEGRDCPRLSWENAPGQPITRVYSYGGGTGTQADPYLIYTPEQLNMIGLIACDWDKHFKLMADIDLSVFDGKDGRPAFNIIATDTDTAKSGFQGTSFTGVFDGNGHTVSHLTIRGNDFVGLFRKLQSGAEVKDLGVVDVNVVGSGDYVGGLVGFNGGEVIRCYSTGAVSGAERIGGLVGYNSGSVTHCHSTGVVSGTGDWDVGGLVGTNRGDVTHCYATGAVTGGWFVGGVVGWNEDGRVTQCYSTGAVSGGAYVGGLVGSDGDSEMAIGGAVTRCYSTGAVSGGAYVGGLMGDNWGTVTGCFWDTQTSGQATSDGGTGKTTAEMRTGKTFLEAGWDFVNVWGIGENQTYPYLHKYSAADINQDGSVNFLDFAVLAENWLTGMAP